MTFKHPGYGVTLNSKFIKKVIIFKLLMFTSKLFKNFSDFKCVHNFSLALMEIV